jgi:adenosylhomocysteine nucleosidase
MRILVVEDSDQNYNELSSRIYEHFPNFSIQILRCTCLSDFVRKINVEKYDLIIFDIVIPRRDGEPGFDLSLDLISERSVTANAATPAIAFTSMVSPEYDTLLRFNECMIPVLLRNDRSSLDRICSAISELTFAPKIDFLLLCALEKEADGFAKCDVYLGPWEIGIGASRRRAIHIQGLRGYLYILPRAGLTNAALITAKAIEYYHPRVVAMSGICAGVSDECNFTDILVAEIAWDYQVGKFTEEGFKSEPYQEGVDVNLINRMKHYCAVSDIGRRVADFVEQASAGEHTSVIRFGPVASGSAVIADKSKADMIGLQHRKFIGIEMEIAAVYSACKYSSRPPVYFAAKSVVDFADRDKSDAAHECGSAASAVFVSGMLLHLFG